MPSFDKLAADVISALQPKRAGTFFPIDKGVVDIEKALAKNIKGYKPKSAKFGKLEAYGHPTDAQVAFTYKGETTAGKKVDGEIRLQCDLKGETLHWDWAVIPA